VTATTPANLPALVWRQWDREDDCFHALAWAEWLEEHGQPDRGELVRLLDEGRHALDCDCTRCRRSRELRAKLSAWPCGACRGKGCWADGPLCPTCDGTGDVLVGSNGDAHFQFPLEWDCGYPRWVTLPTIDECVRLETLGGGPIRVGMGYRPTPRLRALAAVPPWGVPLEGVRVRDREPASSTEHPSEWFWGGNVNTYPWGVPTPVFRLLSGRVDASSVVHLSYHPSEQAAADAFARGLVRFAREYEG